MTTILVMTRKSKLLIAGGLGLAVLGFGVWYLRYKRLRTPTNTPPVLPDTELQEKEDHEGSIKTTIVSGDDPRGIGGMTRFSRLEVPGFFESETYQIGLSRTIRSPRNVGKLFVPFASTLAPDRLPARSKKKLIAALRRRKSLRKFLRPPSGSVKKGDVVLISGVPFEGEYIVQEVTIDRSNHIAGIVINTKYRPDPNRTRSNHKGTITIIRPVPPKNKYTIRGMKSWR